MGQSRQRHAAIHTSKGRLLTFVLVLSCSAAHAAELRAGAARVSITPAASEFPFQPASEQRPIVGVHDEVYARALVLDDGQRRVALVSLEVTKVPGAADIASAVAQELGAPVSHVMLAATHTHNVLTTSYRAANPTPVHLRDLERIKSGAVAAVRQARAALQAARVSFANGQAWVNANNGERLGKKEFDASGPSDKTVGVVRLEDLSGRPIALLVNYASHAEVMFRSVTRDGGYEISGDLPGAVSRLLESHQAGAPVALYTSAAEADQMSLFKSVQPAGRLPASDEGAGGWALLDAMARRLAESVLEATPHLTVSTTSAEIRAATGAVTCPGQQLRINATTGQVTVQPRPPVDIPLSMIRINDIVLAGVSGDVASEIGMAFKAASPSSRSMMITMVGDAIGYILSDESYQKPGHGVAGSPLQAGCAKRAIVDGLVRLAK